MDDGHERLWWVYDRSNRKAENKGKARAKYCGGREVTLYETGCSKEGYKLKGICTAHWTTRKR